jgi:enterochelin esterase-like enzyme
MRHHVAFLLMASAVVAHSQVAAQGDPASLPVSPRLQSLEASLGKSDPEALESFWAEVKVKHTPIQETVSGHSGETLFTFLLRARQEGSGINARLYGSWPMADRGNGFQRFARLGTSDVWYVSQFLPRSARFNYGIGAPQGLQQSPDANWRGVLDGYSYELFRDPLNPTTFTGISYVEGPSAPSSPEVTRVTTVPQGRVESLEVRSQSSGESRIVRVYVPATLTASSHRAALLVCFDGKNWETDLSTPIVLDNLIAKRAIPPTIAVFVDPDPHVGRSELQPNPALQDFIAHDLYPALKQHYRIRSDSASHVVAGSSLGGLAAAYIALEHPELFGGVISMSGAYWWAPGYQTDGDLSPKGGWLIKQFAERKRGHPVRIYMTVGTWENSAMRLSNDQLYSVLQKKNASVVFDEFVGGHELFNWKQKLPEAIEYVLGHP